jgi:hypothetical protein
MFKIYRKVSEFLARFLTVGHPLRIPALLVSLLFFCLAATWTFWTTWGVLSGVLGLSNVIGISAGVGMNIAVLKLPA